MTSNILWHGTPADIPSSAIHPRFSYFEAVWLSSAPEVAAHYAGMSGWVHGFVPAPEARFLVATGHARPHLPHAYPDAATWGTVMEWLADEEHLDLDAFDCLDPAKLARGARAPLGPDGQPSWEELLAECSELDGTSDRLLALLGVDGALVSERPALALGDRAGDATDPTHRELMGRLRGREREPVATLGAVRPGALVPVCRLPALGVARAYLSGHGLPRADASAIAAWSSPTPPPMGRPPSPRG